MRLLLFLTLLFCFENSFSQKISSRKLRKHFARVAESRRKGTVIVSLDTIFDKGLPYAILKKIKQLPYYSFTLFSLAGEELVDIDPKVGANVDHTLYYSFLFVATGKIAEPEKYYGFNIEKTVVAYNLVKNGRIDTFGEIKFLKKYPRKFSNPNYVVYITDEEEPEPLNETDIYQTVQRSHEQDIFVGNGTIHQDFKLIGRYKTDERLIRIYLPSGIMVAEASLQAESTTSWMIETLKDKKNWTLETAEDAAVTDITRFLSERDYL